jgi:RimJ/RimL family protein N-acetyltransferase
VTVPAATTRLAFRAWRDDDLPLAMAIWGDPRVAALVGGPFDDGQVRARLATELANQAEHGVAYWPVILADGAPAGCAGLRPREPARRIYELGFYVLPEHWGQGYAVEAGGSVIAFSFDVLAAPAVFAGHHPDNHASRRTLEKLGFRYTHHEIYPPTGVEHPCYELRRPEPIGRGD